MTNAFSERHPGTSGPTTNARSGRRSGAFLKPFAGLFLAGFAGILALVPVLLSAPALQSLPEGQNLPGSVLVPLLLVQPTLLLAAAVAAGVALAERTGLVSLLLRALRGERVPPVGGWGAALALAVAVASAAVAVDGALRAWSPSSFEGVPRLDAVSPWARVVALLYGGVTEELIMRFGLMTALVALGLRLGRGRGRPVVVAVAVLLAALVFALGHLPSLIGLGQTPDAVLLGRTLGLNGALGLLFGWLYARRSLEHAMLAHAASHGVFWTVTPLLAALTGSA